MRKRLLIFVLLIGLLTIQMNSVNAANKKVTSKSKDIVVGANLELSGAIGSYGQATLKGINLAVKEINSSGGVLGKKIKIVKYDNESDNKKVSKGINYLVTKNRAVSILGPIVSTNFISGINIGNKYKIPMITPSGTNVNCTIDEKGKVRNYAFMTAINDTRQGAIAAEFITKNLNINTGAILFVQDSSSGIEIVKGFKNQLSINGGKILSEESYNYINLDVENKMKKIIETNPDFIFMVAYYMDAAEYIKEARRIGYNKPIIGTDFFDSPELVDLAGIENLKDVYYVNHFIDCDPDPRVKEFVESYKKTYKQMPDISSALGYESVYFLVDAIKRAKSTNPEKIKVALAKTSSFNGLIGKWGVDKNHHVIKSGIIQGLNNNGESIYITRINPK